MGSWSVYCGISQIAITSGTKCAVLPLKKNKNGEGYLPMLPATLPIFGTYNDYGNMADVEENENTKLIEEHFGISIEEFLDFLIEQRYNRDEYKAVKKKLKKAAPDKLKELEEWDYMWINREVYDFMSTNVGNGYGGKGHLDMGEPGILKLLGFEYVGKVDKERYNHEWKYPDCETKFYSDGTWLHADDNIGVYSVGALKNFFTLPEDKQWIGEKTTWQMWNVYENQNKRLEQIVGIIGIDRHSLDYLPGGFMHKLMGKLVEKTGGRDDYYKEMLSKMAGFAYKYLDNLEVFGDKIAELVTVRNNLYPMSGAFNPYVCYTTPQCGEHKLHQAILEKFAAINKGYADQYDEDEDDE